MEQIKNTMPRKANDGRGRLGGRTKGTPNKPPMPLHERVMNIINKNWQQFEADLQTLPQQKRAEVIAQLIMATSKEPAPELV